jgi:hypothetical protein
MERCSRCGREYPSQYYFATETLCSECFRSMSRQDQDAVLHEKKTLDPEGATPRVVDGHKLICPICGNHTFSKRKTLMNTAGLTFLGVEWANKQAASFICDSCGYVMWFMREDALS